MTLSEEDGKLFYKLWLPLLDFVNQKYRIRKKVKKMATATELNPEDVKAVANKLYENVSIIDEYLKVTKGIEEDHRQIILSWKKCFTEQFVVERHLKAGSILISAVDGKVYQVSGIISSLEEMFWFYPLPLIIEATLMPFRDVIITDGLVIPYNVEIGGNMKRTFKDAYMTAKTDGKIIKSFTE